MNVKRIAGFVLFFVVLLMGMGDVTSFIDPASGIIVFVGTLGMLLIGGGSIPQMFGAVFSSEATPEELRASIEGWRLARNSSLVAGTVAMIAGLITMMKNIDDPAAIGPGMALALLGTMYAIVLGYGVCLPLQAGLKERAGEAGEKGLMTGATLVFLFAFVLSLGLLVLLMYSFSGTQS